MRSIIRKLISYVKWHMEGRDIWKAKMNEPLRIRIVS